MATRQDKQRESLVDWVRQSEGKPAGIKAESKPRNNRGAGLPPEEVAKHPEYIPLRVWAKLLLGDYAPHINTLLKWVHTGRIQPQPVKMGRHWFVKTGAEYLPD